MLQQRWPFNMLAQVRTPGFGARQYLLKTANQGLQDYNKPQGTLRDGGPQGILETPVIYPRGNR